MTGSDAFELDHVRGLVCVVCGEVYAPAPDRYVCDNHGNEGILDVAYDYDLVGAAISQIPPLTVGGTPMYGAPRLAAATGVGSVWVKDEGRQPTASLKDRASAMAVVKAREFRAEVVTTASTGNAAAALSGISASVGQANVIFVPASAPEAKVAQLLAYGSTVALVNGTYTDAFELCMDAASHFGWYNRNTGFNPYMTEGKKTAGLEILEQLGWRVPDAVFVSVGDGSIIGGLHKAMKDASALGWIDRMPRIFGVQASGSDYLVQAFETGEDLLSKPPISASTVADSISADLPRDRTKAMAAVVETDGAYLRVSDDGILAADLTPPRQGIRRLCRAGRSGGIRRAHRRCGTRTRRRRRPCCRPVDRIGTQGCRIGHASRERSGH